MAETIAHVTHQSWGSRLGGSCKGICCGGLLVIGSIWFLIWNEGNSVAAHAALHEALGAVVEVGDAIDAVDAANENALVHMTGFADTDANVTDSKFGVSLQHTLKLRRHVESYQWVETEHKETQKNNGGSTTTTTTYTYETRWMNSGVNSQTFQEPEEHTNPQVNFGDDASTANPIDFGAFTLPSVATSKMNWFRSLTGADYHYDTSTIPSSTISSMYSSQVSVYQDQGYYFGSSPATPKVGDTRVTFSFVAAQEISIVAKQTGTTFSSYLTSNGRSVLLVEAGVVSTEEMFIHANQQVTAMTFIFRILGFLLLWWGFQMIVGPIAVFGDVIPCVGDLLSGVSCFLTGLLAAAVSVIVVAISWLAYRPLISIPALLGCCGILWYCYNQQRKKKQTPTAFAVPEQDVEMMGNEKGYTDYEDDGEDKD